MTSVAEALTEEEYHKPASQALEIRQERQEVAARPTGAMTPMDMLNHAVSNGQGIEIIDKLMDLQERWEKNQARKAFDEAMAGAKAEIPTIRKNREVDFTSAKGRTHYRHEDLAEVARTVNPILAKHGLSYRFRTSAALNEPVTVTCIVSHRLGYFEENTLTGPRDDSGNKNSLQQVGSTLTYLQRMTLKAALGLAAGEDDDAKASGGAEGEGPITEDQAETIRKMIEDGGRDTEQFCNYFKIDAIPDLPASQFGRAVTALSRKKGGAQ